MKKWSGYRSEIGQENFDKYKNRNNQ